MLTKLNLGCGKQILQGYDNIDLHNNDVIKCDIQAKKA